MINKISAIFLSFLFFNMSSYAEEAAKIFPPYPDVWGVELPVSESIGYAGIDIMKMDDGDYMVKYTAEDRELKSIKEKDIKVSKRKTVRFPNFHFVFSSKKYEFTSSDEFKLFMQKAREEGKILDYPPIIFSDGSNIEVMSGGRYLDMRPGIGEAPEGNIPIDWYLERKDKGGKVLFKKKLLYINDKPIRERILKSKRNINYKGDYYWDRVSTLMQMKFIPLEDDTFILVGFIKNKIPKSVVIVRFDKDLNTKSNIINKKLFLMDESTYEKMRSSSIDDNKAHELLYEYLTKPNIGSNHIQRN